MFVVFTPPDNVKYALAVVMPGHAIANDAGGMAVGVGAGVDAGENEGLAVSVDVGEAVLALAMQSTARRAAKRMERCAAAGGLLRGGSGDMALPREPRHYFTLPSLR